ncbi:phosphatidylinositol 4-phosphate 5-kinase-like protein 1 isoform X1 [Brienomyrus brachyistius]|uniref:phosphatidylinositol 4-phosphate 5-kinase-like protein 1 isoform X1 n=2 Tax=Brienomyrus brachyistius TaxID=42636 RepID=UPI0020B42F42|nr:phosphatidylinositol 4-phosphate 5-kinase-like protein 1 isoform X1 [Brienomyrus brachyistius]
MSRTEQDGRQRYAQLWVGLRQQWRMLGLFEIDPQHKYYSLTCMMKEGLSAAVQDAIDRPPPNELSEDDFNMEVTRTHQGFQMQTFVGPVFSCLRRSLGIGEREFQQALSPQGCYLQFISNSKSKAKFFLTNDKRFFLKTQSKQEVRFLLSNLRNYMKHLENYPHSVLVRFLGVHRIKLLHKKEKYFVVMQSVFHPGDRIIARYDIKGCEVNRWTDPALEKSQLVMVLKDKNFEGNFINLGHQSSWLVRQVEIDTAFLRRMNVMDYSLLLACQRLRADECGRSLAVIVQRAKKSVSAGSSPSPTDPPTVPGPAPEDIGTVLVPEMSPGHLCCVAGGEEHVPLKELPKQPVGNSADSELQEFWVQHRRLLPDFKNPLHVIDGPELRYFVGIVDIVTVYDFWRRLGCLWKSLRYPGKTFCTVSPSAYSRRLCQWVREHTK